VFFFVFFFFFFFFFFFLVVGGFPYRALQDLASIEPPPNFSASLSASATVPAVAKPKPMAKLPAKSPRDAAGAKLAPLQTEKAGTSVSASPSSPTTPKSGKLKEAASPRVAGDGVEVLNNVINLKAAVDKMGNIVSFQANIIVLFMYLVDDLNTFCPIEIVTRNDRWSIRLYPADSPFTSRELVQPNKIVVKRDGDRIEETLEKMETGIEHAFLVKSGPSTPFSLKLGIKTDGITKTTVHDSNLCFWGGDSPVFAYLFKNATFSFIDFNRYQNLVVHDATGKQLQSKMFWDTKGPHIVLDVLEVPKYPVTIGKFSFPRCWRVLICFLQIHLLQFPVKQLLQDFLCHLTLTLFSDPQHKLSKLHAVRRKANRTSPHLALKILMALLKSASLRYLRITYVSYRFIYAL
jgi:hypothetical protein